MQGRTVKMVAERALGSCGRSFLSTKHQAKPTNTVFLHSLGALLIGWVSINEGALALLSNNTAEIITAGNYTGDAGDDLFLDFGASGLWASVNGGPLFFTNVPSPTAMVTGDVDSSGEDDLILSVAGTVVAKNLSATASIAVLDAAVALDLATGNVDGN